MTAHSTPQGEGVIDSDAFHPGMRSVPSDPTTSGGLAPAEAFARYVEPEIEVLLRVARRLTGCWPDAEDLVQDTLIRAFRAIHTFDGAHPRAWLLTILRHTHANSHRRRRPALLDADDAVDRHRPAFDATQQPSPEQTVTDRALSADLQQAVAGLNPKLSTVLLLVDVDDLSYGEAAEVLGVPIGTVTSRLSRARKRVRRTLTATTNARRNT